MVHGIQSNNTYGGWLISGLHLYTTRHLFGWNDCQLALAACSLR